jgi:hypothetical protein
MDIRTEASIRDQDVASAQFRMHFCNACHVMRSQRRGQHLGDHASPCVQHDQPMRDGKAAPGLLPAWLAKVSLQLRRIGHRETRTVHLKHPMAEPTRRAECFLLQRVDTPLEQQVEHFEIHSHPGFAIRGRCERHAGQMRQMLASGIAVQDLHEENLDRDNRIERRFVPLHTSIATRLSDGVRREFFGPILLETS